MDVPHKDEPLEYVRAAVDDIDRRPVPTQVAPGQWLVGLLAALLVLTGAIP